VKVDVKRDEHGLVTIKIDGAGYIGGSFFIANLEEGLQKLANQVKTRCAEACEAREKAHYTTIEKAKACNSTEVDHKAREARKCADAIRKL
jgi:hypothetical protein